ncbi:MAG: hypothetical protein M3439_07640 [Chloroflexota bacterium]|nr:hypothetical protein [Chloroflexota bacterium]
MTTIGDHDIRVALTEASLDAPRVDLWERLEAPVSGLSRTRRPFRQALRSLAAVMAILLVGAGMLTIFSLAEDGPDNRAQQLNTVPDLLLMTTWDEQTQASNLRAYVPESDGLLSVLEGISVSDRHAISRDGQQVVYTGWQQEEETWTLRLWSFDSTTLATQWTADITSVAATSADFGYPGAGHSTTIAGDRVYVSWHDWDTPFPIPIQAIERTTGEQVGSWEIDIGDPQSKLRVGSSWLTATPDGSRLDMLTQVWDTPQASSNQVRTAYFAFALPEMRETQRVIQASDTPVAERFYPRDAGRAPDGRTLYSVNGGYYNDPLRVEFFDLDSSTLSDRVELDFGAGFEISQQTTVSADGRLLYIFDSTSGKLATVDLVAQRLVGTATVDMSIVQASGGSLLGRALDAVSGMFVQDAAAKINFAGSMQLSPDGRRLYAVGITGRDEVPNGVLVIDTATWQVVEHWLSGQHPVQLITGGSGRYLYAMTVAWANQGESGMRIIDTATGEEVVVSDELRDAGSPYNTYSVAEIYRDAWGVSPAIAGVDPDDLSVATRTDPFAKMSVSVSAETTVAGGPVTVELRYLDPKTGEPIAEDTDGVRFDEPGHVRALMSKNNSNATEQTIVLARSEYGVYHGAAILPSAGAWTIQVIAEREGEPSRYASIRDAVVAQPTMLGSDGRRYMLVVETVQPPARPEQETLVRVSIVDAETGTPLLKGVELAGGLPTEMDGSATLEQRAVTSADLVATSRNGIYEGYYNFFAAGRWNISVNFPRTDCVQAGYRRGLWWWSDGGWIVLVDWDSPNNNRPIAIPQFLEPASPFRCITSRNRPHVTEAGRRHALAGDRCHSHVATGRLWRE